MVNFDPRFIISGIFRAAMDLQAYGIVPLEAIDSVLTRLKQVEEQNGP